MENTHSPVSDRHVTLPLTPRHLASFAGFLGLLCLMTVYLAWRSMRSDTTLVRTASSSVVAVTDAARRDTILRADAARTTLEHEATTLFNDFHAWHKTVLVRWITPYSSDRLDEISHRLREPPTDDYTIVNGATLTAAPRTLYSRVERTLRDTEKILEPARADLATGASTSAPLSTLTIQMDEIARELAEVRLLQRRLNRLKAYFHRHPEIDYRPAGGNLPVQ